MAIEFISVYVNGFLNQLLGSYSYLGVGLIAVLGGLYFKTYRDENWFVSIFLMFMFYGGLRYFGFG